MAGKEAALLSIVEIGLGSILHSFKMPLSGHFLSLNQCFLLSRATLDARAGLGARARLLPLNVSAVAAILKSLAPAGKKLTPMLAISAQGALFTVGTLVFGANPIGVAVGAAVSSLWAFTQPLLIYYLIFGQDLFVAASGVYEKLSHALGFEASSGLWMLAGVIALKVLLAVSASILAANLPEELFERYRTGMLRAGSRIKPGTVGSSTAAESKGRWGIHARLAVRDLLSPLFMLSLVLTVGFFVFVETEVSRLIWISMRPIAAGFLVFFLLRVLPMERLTTMLEQIGFRSLGRSMQIALEALRRV